jgi:hypothetical protein
MAPVGKQPVKMNFSLARNVRPELKLNSAHHHLRHAALPREQVNPVRPNLDQFNVQQVNPVLPRAQVTPILPSTQQVNPVLPRAQVNPIIPSVEQVNPVLPRAQVNPLLPSERFAIGNVLSFKGLIKLT